MCREYKYSYAKLIGKFRTLSLLLKNEDILYVLESFALHWNDDWSKLSTYKKSSILLANQSEQYLRWVIWNYATKVFTEDSNLKEFDFLSHFEQKYYSSFPEMDKSLIFIRQKKQFKNGLILIRRKSL